MPFLIDIGVFLAKKKGLICPESTSCCAVERNISKDEQLLHTYGDLSDAQLLQTYGFVEEFEPGYDNPHNFVPVPAQLVLQSCSESGDEVCTSQAASCDCAAAVQPKTA